MPSLPCCLDQCLAWRCAAERLAYLLGLERVVGCLDGHVLFAADLDSVRDDALGVALVAEGFGNHFAFSLGDLMVSLAWELKPRNDIPCSTPPIVSIFRNGCVQSWTVDVR